MEGTSGHIRVNRVDIEARTIRLADVTWQDGVLVDVDDLGPEDPSAGYLIPGFVDAHVHIETSLLTPSEFARVAVRHGTVASVSDPHEIANVLGIDGVRWMITDAAATPFTVLFGAPSCVPATRYETSGARLDAGEVEALLDTPGVGYLSEVMDYPGVLTGEPGVLAKIGAAVRRGMPVDGHAPGLLGESARTYAAAGITTDHECSTLDEAEEQIRTGMLILIREGSAARNFEALHPLISRHPGRTMLCTDDADPTDLVRGQIDRLVARAIAHGHDVFTVLQAACLTPREHYRLPIGRLRPGEPFTGVLVDDLHGVRPRRTWLAGRLVARDGVSLLPRVHPRPVNAFGARPVAADELAVRVTPVSRDRVTCRVITAADGDLLTGVELVELPVVTGEVQPDPDRDVLLMAVVNRYRPAPPSLAFIRGFGLTRGAIASSVAHDSHNVIGVGTDAASLAHALNAVIVAGGGLAAVDEELELLPLPVAGLMSDLEADDVAARLTRLLDMVRVRLGSPLHAPLMTLSFMSLLVIPSLKLSDRGLFDVDRFAFTELTCPR